MQTNHPKPAVFYFSLAVLSLSLAGCLDMPVLETEMMPASGSPIVIDGRLYIVTRAEAVWVRGDDAWAELDDSTGRAAVADEYERGPLRYETDRVRIDGGEQPARVLTDTLTVSSTVECVEQPLAFGPVYTSCSRYHHRYDFFDRADRDEGGTLTCPIGRVELESRSGGVWFGVTRDGVWMRVSGTRELTLLDSPM